MSDLEARITRLEVSERRWRTAALFFGCIALVGIFSGATDNPPPSDLVQTKQLQILNKDGKAVVVATSGATGVGELQLCDPEGTERISLRLMPFNKQFLPLIKMLDQNGKESVNLSVDQDGFGALDLAGRNKEEKLVGGINLTTSSRGAVLQVKSQTGVDVATMSGINKTGTVRTCDDQQRPTGHIGG